jgi:transposase
VVDAIRYSATGCRWGLPTRDSPPFTTVQRYVRDWRNGGFLRTINHLMVMAGPELEGHEASPSARIIISQSVKTTENGGPRGFGEGRPWPLRGAAQAPRTKNWSRAASAIW